MLYTMIRVTLLKYQSSYVAVLNETLKFLFGTVRTKLSLILAGKIMYSLALPVLRHFQRHLHSVPDMLPLVFVISIRSLIETLAANTSKSCSYTSFTSLLWCYLIKETSLTMLSKLVTSSLSIHNLCLLLFLSIYSLLSLLSFCIYYTYVYYIHVYIY